MPRLAAGDLCCGCGACASKCHAHAIHMEANEEGFLHPVVDRSKCIECENCEKVCPALNVVRIDNNFEPHAYIVQHKDDIIRYESTSGGAFSAIAEEILKRGGVVFGAALDDDFVVRHRYVETINKLSLFRNSKYVQSDPCDSFRDVERFLKQNRWVCFSGTPCQINGLRNYLGCDYEKLVLIDVVCHAVPSPLVWTKYIDLRKSDCPFFTKVVFRDKKRGYSYSTMTIYNEKDSTEHSLYRHGAESDEWFRLFLGDKYNRLSCYSCRYQSGTRCSDFTLWDRWSTKDVRKEWNDNKGTTNVIVWTDKAHLIFNSINESVRSQEFPVQIAKRLASRHNLVSSASDRDVFFKDAHLMNAQEFFKKYEPKSVKVKLKSAGRILIWKLHIHNYVRTLAHILR